MFRLVPWQTAERRFALASTDSRWYHANHPSSICPPSEKHFPMVPRETTQSDKKPAKKGSEPVTIALSVGVELVMLPIPSKDYRMGKFSVTQAQWEAVMGDNPSYFKGADRPVECVSWDDCQEFLEKLNALPAARKRTNGNTPAARAQRATTASLPTGRKSPRRYSVKSHGSVATRMISRIPWDRKRRTPSGSTICSAMYVNGRILRKN